MQAGKSQFDNLIAILAVSAILALIGLAIGIANRYAGDDATAYQSAKKITGYVRPQRQSTPDVHLKFRDDIKPGPDKGELVVSMGPEDAKKLDERFQQAVALLHARQYEYAIKALEQVIQLQPRLPEAHVNIGYAYMGLEQWDVAVMAFQRAADLNPEQANAYYGLAMALEGQKEYEGALGAMRTYIHLSTPDDPFVAKARSALWEWEAILGRIPGAEEAPEGETAQLIPKGSPHQQSQ